MRKIVIDYIPNNVMQQGGLTNAQMLTGNYQEASNNPTVEVEKGEHTKNSETGAVKKVEGKRHVDGGEKVNLPDQSKVLSDYTKIGAQNTKIFEEMFDIKAKASDTFAKVLDKFNTKIGVKKIEEEEVELLEKLEKNTKSSIDATTKKINEDFLAQEISEINKKKEALNKIKAEAFEAIFKEQEKVPKKGDGSQVLNKAGNPIKQEGGEQQAQGQPDPQQIIQAYAQLAGQDPNEVMQQLQSLAPEQQQAALQQMVQALQQGQSQMREGGMYNGLPIHQTKGKVEEKPYSFQTQYTPTVAGYTVTGDSILNQPLLSDVEYMQHFTGKGYGQKMADIDKTINTHKWYFDTEDKKKAFREAAASSDSKGVVKNFQNAYNEQLAKRGKDAGLSQEEIGKLTKDVGFTGEGVQQLDDKFGAFTSTRPLFNFDKIPEEIPEQPGVTPQRVQRDLVKNIVSTEGLPYVIPPSAPIAPYLQQVNLNRLEGQKGSVENQLQASANARQAAYESTRGLPPAQAAAVMANYLSTSGQQDTAGIAHQEQQDLANKARTEQYNASQGDKEQILNEQLKKQYEKEAFATLNVNEQNWRNYYDANQANQKALSDKIERRNIMNLGLTNYQLNGSGGFDFVNKSPFQMQVATDPRLKAMYDAMSPEQKMAYEKAYTAKSRLS